MASSLSSLDSNSSKLYYFTAVVAVAAVPLLLASLSKKKNKKRSLKRSWSFTSQGMCIGVFPPATKAPATIINAALYFDTSGGEKGMPSEAELVEQVIQPLLQYERFATAPPYYEHATATDDDDETPKFNPQDLVRTIQVTVPDKAKDKDGENALHQTMYKLLEDSLERPNLPWFEVVRLVNTSTKSKSARSICLLRVHHCLGDGLSLVAAFDKIITTLDGKPSESKVTNAMMNKKPAKPPVSSILSALFHVLGVASSKFDDPTVFFKRAPKHLEYSGNRKVTLFPNVPLAYMKLLKNKYNDNPDNSHRKITLNDIMMCAVSQSIYEYCVAQKDPLIQEKAQALQCRALLPASLPRSKHSLQDTATAMTNQFCMVSADMSVGYSDILERLSAIHTTTSFLKTSPRAFVQLWLQNNVVSKLPIFVGQTTALDIFSRHSLVLTNVPGPPETCLIGSKVVQGLQLFFPNVIPQVDLLTYAGTVYGNIIYDPDCLPEGDSLAGLYAKALVTMGREFKLDAQEIPKELIEAAKSV